MNNDEEEVVSTDQAMENTMKRTMSAIKERDNPTVNTSNPKIETQKTEKSDNSVLDEPKVGKPLIGKQRDTTGRFTKGVETQEAPPTEITGQPAEEGKTPAIPASPAPSSWPEALKAEWNTTPPAVRTQVLKREAEIQRALQANAEKNKRFDGLDKVIAPHRDFFTMHYGSVEKGIADLMAINDVAVKNPKGFVAWFCQTRGINPAELSQGQPKPQQVDPNMAALLNRVNGLEQTLTQKQQAEEQRQQALAAQTIESFAADPKNVHFEELRNDMALLLENGMADNPQDAYDKALRLRPDLFEQVWQQKMEEQNKARQEQAEKEAKTARRDAVHASATRPNAGATPSQPKSIWDSLKDNHKRIYSDGAA